MVLDNVQQPYGDCPWPTPQVTDVICSWQTDKREWKGAGKSDSRGGNHTKVFPPITASTPPTSVSFHLLFLPFIGTIPSGPGDFCTDGERASLHVPRPSQDCAFYSGGFGDHNGRTTRCDKLRVSMGSKMTGFLHLLNPQHDSGGKEIMTTRANNTDCMALT